jgi:sulfate transport system substrate-binding protein
MNRGPIMPRRRLHSGLAALFAALAFAAPGVSQAETLLNVSYDPTRELYKQFNAAFTQHWREQTGETVNIRMSHGGSGKQARSVIDGLEADVVTLALEADIDAIAEKSGKIPRDWRSRLPNNSAPYTSTIVFLVRKGNPKAIKDWGDLVRDGIQVITPNPKTSGGARWNFLAAWAWAEKQYGKDEAKVRTYVTTLFKHVPVLDTGARGSTTTFVQRGIGDVLLAWENEAFLALEEIGPDKVEIIVPSVSIKAEPPVALVDGNVDAKSTRKAAQAYLEYLYTKTGQQLAAKNFYRPSKPELVEPQDMKRFPDVELVTIEAFGGWSKVQPRFFGDRGIFDEIYKPGR